MIRLLRRLWLSMLITFDENYTLEGFEKLKKDFGLPDDHQLLDPHLKRQMTVCNLFANQDLSIRDIAHLLELSLGQVVTALIDNGLIRERRRGKRALQRQDSGEGILQPFSTTQSQALAATASPQAGGGWSSMLQVGESPQESGLNGTYSVASNQNENLPVQTGETSHEEEVSSPEGTSEDVLAAAKVEADLQRVESQSAPPPAEAEKTLELPVVSAAKEQNSKSASIEDSRSRHSGESALPEKLQSSSEPAPRHHVNNLGDSPKDEQADESIMELLEEIRGMLVETDAASPQAAESPQPNGVEAKAEEKGDARRSSRKKPAVKNGSRTKAARASGLISLDIGGKK